MDINRLQQLAGILNESVEIEEDVRQVTNALHTMMDEGILDPRTVADACLKYMSKDDVRDMAHANELPTGEDDLYGDEDEDEDDDLDPDYFDDLDAGDTEMDRRSDLRRGW